jgi:membrane-associated phospholipid phosphatase
MEELPFNIELIRVLAEGRTEFLTGLFQFFTFLGEVEGYVLLVTLIYVVYDKTLAYRLCVLTLVTMSLNHLLKTIVMNPRPFITDGTYAERWAVSPDKAAELATEYSTPSGHAMAGSAFYSYLLTSVRNTQVRVACVLLLLLTGLSRPYLGVHYLEDVLVGWVLGASIALVAMRYATTIAGPWGRLSHPQQIAVVAAASLMLWITTRVLSDPDVGDQPLAFIGYTGFLMGVVVAFPLEAKVTAFDPRSSPAWKKMLRYPVGVGLILGTLLVLDELFQRVAGDYSVLGYLLRYIRYALAGISGILVGPILFVRLGLAETLAVESGARRPTGNHRKATSSS